MDLGFLRAEINKVGLQIEALKDCLVALESRRQRMIIFCQSEEDLGYDSSPLSSRAIALEEDLVQLEIPTQEAIALGEESKSKADQSWYVPPQVTLGKSPVVVKLMVEIVDIARQKKLDTFSSNYICSYLEKKFGTEWRIAHEALQLGRERGLWESLENDQETWRSLCNKTKSPEEAKKKSKPDCSSFSKFMKTGTKNGLVENSTTFFELLCKVFERNRDAVLTAGDIYLYLYGEVDYEVPKDSKRHMLQGIASALCNYINRSGVNYKRVSKGNYRYSKKN